MTFDHGWLQETFLQFALEIIARGYAVVVYEGPGQGPVLKSPPNMPFYAGELFEKETRATGSLSWRETPLSYLL